MEVILRLERNLRSNPAQQLIRTRHPFDGMSYLFSLVDPTNRFREYQFVFHIVYAQDEETLLVANCGYAAVSI